jgi:hypothetical protein
VDSDIKFHVFETRTSKAMKKFMGLTAIVNKIKRGDAYTPFIEAIRKVEKDTPLYESIENGRECIIWNATSGISKNNDKRIMKGIIHLEKRNISEALMQASKSLLKGMGYVISTWKSFDGKGVECLVRYDGITPSTFKDAWHEINEATGLEFTFNALENAEASLISYDKDIYYNPEASNFLQEKPHLLKVQSSASESALSAVQLSLLKVQLDILQEEEYDRIAPQDYDYSGKKFRYQTELNDDVFGDEEFKVFPKGIPFYKINSYYLVEGKKRQSTMYAQAAILIKLNPLYNEKTIVNRLDEINFYQCKPRLSKSEIEFIVMVQYERQKAGTLKINPGIRKIVYKTNSNFLLKDKRQLNAVVSGKIKATNTYNSLKANLSTLMESGRTIIQKDLIEISKSCERTAKTYWVKYFKNDVAEYNKSIAAN